jgi:hypothetical protein
MASGTERALVCFARLVKADDRAAVVVWLDGGGHIDGQFMSSSAQTACATP